MQSDLIDKEGKDPEPLIDLSRTDRASSVRSSRSDRSLETSSKSSNRREGDGESRRKHRSDRDDSDRRSSRRGEDRERRDGGDSRRERGRDGDDYRGSKRRRSRSRSGEPRGESNYNNNNSRNSRDNRDNNRGGNNDRRNYRDDRYDDDNRSRRDRNSPSYDTYAREAPPSRPQRSESPQLSEEQREMRSVFVSQLSARVTDRELSIFFDTQAGKVREAKVITDRISRRSKGVGYVEFVDLETVQKALSLSNTKLLGIPIIVTYTEAEKNRQARDGTAPVPQPTTGLYVGSLNFALTESDIRQVFQPFGPVEVVDLHKDPTTGKSKGFAFVQFKNAADAAQALEKMNNFPLAGREIKVGTVAEKTSGTGGGGSGASAAYARGPEPQLDDGTGGNLNQISRMELMQKLSRSDKPVVELPKAPMFRPNIPLATTRNVMMKDAFDPSEETERDWDTELRDDVKSEVESKYGKVSEIFVVKESQGEIYIRFETVDFAIQAVAGLNGRWFGGRQISAQHLTDAVFDAKK